MNLSRNKSTNPMRRYFSCTGAEGSLMDCRRSNLLNGVGCSTLAGVICPSEYFTIINGINYSLLQNNCNNNLTASTQIKIYTKLAIHRFIQYYRSSSWSSEIEHHILLSDSGSGILDSPVQLQLHLIHYCLQQLLS